MSRGPRPPRKLVDKETHEITNFMFASLHPEPGSVVFTQEIYAAYSAWRKRQGLEPSTFSLLSFGRIFFTYFERPTKVVYREGNIGRGLENYRVKA